MSFDNRLRDELRHAADAHDLREDDALQQVKTSGPSEWADMTVVALEDSSRSRHTRAQRIVGALAACALIAGAIALPVALRSRSRATGAKATGAATPSSTSAHAVAAGYRSTTVLRIVEAPSTATSTTTKPLTVKLGDPVKFALTPGICNATLQRSRLRSGPDIGFGTSTNASGDMLSLTAITPTARDTRTLARNWAAIFRRARIADAKNRIRQQQHDLNLRVVRLHDDLRRVDEQLVKLMPIVYKGVLRFDAPNGNLPNRRSGGPPPVPEQGTPRALNLAFERIQLLSSLTEAGTKASELRITAVKPDVFATLVSQTQPVLIRTPHRDSNTSTVLLTVGLLAGGALLLGSAFWLGRRTRRPQPS